MTDTSLDDILDKYEVAALMGRSHQTIAKWVKAGTFPAGRRFSTRTIRWRRGDVLAAMEGAGTGKGKGGESSL
jgi:predicted DNA-binding transcriptional regulator AlpA